MKIIQSKKQMNWQTPSHNAPLTHLTIIQVLEDAKGYDINHINIGAQTSLAEDMIIVSGRSRRHAQSLAHHVIEKVKEQKHAYLSVEGLENSQWILLDLGDMIVHIFTEETRTFYNLDKLWANISPSEKEE